MSEKHKEKEAAPLMFGNEKRPADGPSLVSSTLKLRGLVQKWLSETEKVHQLPKSFLLAAKWSLLLGGLKKGFKTDLPFYLELTGKRAVILLGVSPDRANSKKEAS